MKKVVADKSLRPFFDERILWDVNRAMLDYDRKAKFIIERVFERGDVSDISQCRAVLKLTLLNTSIPDCPIQRVEGIRMLSVEDIIAMKLNAILGRGTKRFVGSL